MREKLNGLDLFSGIGGNTIALNEWIKTIAYCDFDRHAQSILFSRMRSGDIEPAPIWDDVTTLTAKQFACPIDIIVGGFPCQDISTAGRGAGIKENTRSGLFFQVIRLVKELEPAFVFLENVPAIRTRGLDIVLQELTQAGYDCRWTMLSASSLGALHKRERWFLLAHPNSSELRIKSGRSEWENGKDSPEPEFDGIFGAVANSMCERWTRRNDSDSSGEADETCERSKFSRAGSESGRAWEIEPNVGRVADGVSFRVDRLKRLGNSVVPQQAKEAFKILMGLR